MSTSPNFYTRLGLTKGATLEDIRLAYRQAARYLHPDVNQDHDATEVFMQMKEAYEVLSDPVKRAAYDGSPSSDEDSIPLILNSFYSQPVLTRIDQPQLVYVLLEMIPIEDQISDSSSPLNLCLVIDRSTSMQGERMDMVKKTAIELVHQLRPDDILSIVVFNDRAELLLPASQPFKPGDIESSIRMIQTGGGTEIFQGLETGFLEVHRKRKKNLINHLILITDGHTYGDESACLQLGNRAASQGIGITGLGIGNEWNDAFLDDLASRTGSSSMYVAEPVDIGRLLKRKLRKLGQICIDHIILDAQMGEKVSLTYAFRLEPESSSLNTTPPLHLGGIPHDAKLKLILEFFLDPLPTKNSNLVLADGFFTFQIPSKSNSNNTLQFNLRSPIEKSANFELPPDDLIQSLEQLTLYRMQENVQQEVTAGDFTNATRHLQFLATHLLSRGKRDLAYAIINEIDHLNQHHSFSEAGKKRLKYGTRALILPE